jgi:hypothetical protein
VTAYLAAHPEARPVDEFTYEPPSYSEELQTALAKQHPQCAAKSTRIERTNCYLETESNTGPTVKYHFMSRHGRLLVDAINALYARREIARQQHDEAAAALRDRQLHVLLTYYVRAKSAGAVQSWNTGEGDEHVVRPVDIPAALKASLSPFTTSGR